MNDYAYPKVNFIGNKEKLAPWICSHIPPEVRTVFDAFSGGCSVSYEAKRLGYQVFSNDALKINHLLAQSLIENRSVTLSGADVDLIFSGRPRSGFMSKNFSDIYFFEDECRELDQIHSNIPKLKNRFKIALAFSLMRRAMIRKMPYSRFNIPWSKVVQLRDEAFSYKYYKRKRAYHNASFRDHFTENLAAYNAAVFDNGKANRVFNEDTTTLVENIKADLIYLDPPYAGTLNNYFDFYGLLDQYVASKRIQPFRNNFTAKNETTITFDQLFSRLKNFRYWFLSYNNGAYPDKLTLFNLLKRHASHVSLVERKHNYKITGKKTKNLNREYLFIVKR